MTNHQDFVQVKETVVSKYVDLSTYLSVNLFHHMAPVSQFKYAIFIAAITSTFKLDANKQYVIRHVNTRKLANWLIFTEALQ